MPSAKLEQLTAAASNNKSPEEYADILQQIKELSKPSTLAADLIYIADSIFESAGGVVFTRSALEKFIVTLKSFENPPDLWI